MSSLHENATDRLLVVHADDLGMTEAINRGVQRTHAAGILTSMSLLVNGAAFAGACEWVKAEKLPAGLHLNLTDGMPLLHPEDVSTLVTPRGFFPGKWGMVRRILSGRISAQEIEMEIRAQIEYLLMRGINVDHLDSHHHIHLLPPVAAVAGPLAREYGLRWVRRISVLNEGRCAHKREFHGMVQQFFLSFCSWASSRHYEQTHHARHFWGMAWYESEDKQRLFARLVARLRPGINEWMCHPALLSATDTGGAAAKHRAEELGVLCAAETRQKVLQSGAKLVSIRACINTH